MTRVLPVPAPAKIRIGPSTASTASRCWGFRLLRISIYSKISAGSALWRMHFSRADRSEQTRRKIVFNRYSLNRKARRSVGRRTEINLKEKQGLRVIHESKVGHLDARAGDPVIMPVDIEVDKAVRRGMRGEQIRVQGSRTHVRGEILPLFVVRAARCAYARNGESGCWILWPFGQNAIGHVFGRKRVELLAGSARGPYE